MAGKQKIYCQISLTLQYEWSFDQEYRDVVCWSNVLAATPRIPRKTAVRDSLMSLDGQFSGQGPKLFSMLRA